MTNSTRTTRESASWPEVLGTLLDRRDLTSEQAAWAMDEILSDAATPAQIAGFAIALRVKGETVAELSGLVGAMYAHAVPIRVAERAVDVVGTGGDRAHTVNISTMAALVAAGAGARVVKHGNRSASSLCGAADLVEALGVPLDLPAERVAALAGEVGITFCFAPFFHPALRFAGPTRRELGVPTVFNLLGPMANPARPAAQAIGVADPRRAALIAGLIAERGTEAAVFHGDDGLDELTTSTTSRVWVVRQDPALDPAERVREISLDPLELGIARSAPDALRGGDVEHNTQVCRRLLDGETGPVRDAVVLNAAAALCVYDPGPEPFVERMRAAVTRAGAAIDSGAAAGVLDRWVKAAHA